MKAIFRLILAMTFAAGLLCSCTVDNPEVVPEGTLRIFADKTEITADGVDQVTFRVMYGSEEVTAKKTMTITVNGKDSQYDLPAGAGSFSTAVAGTYTFTATYYYGGDIVTDNSVTVEATKVQTGKYYQKLLAMQFTSTLCPSCPSLSSTLKSISKNYPDRMSVVAFHVSAMGTDPMHIKMCDTFFKSVSDSDGLPAFAFNVRKNTEHIISEYNKIENELKRQLRDYPATCGVALESSVSGSNADITVKITSEVASKVKYHIFLVEDGLDYDQLGSYGGYVHDNVLRVCKSDSVWGTNLNSGKALEPGIEYTVQASISLEADWKVANMRVVALAMTSSDGGMTYGCNNLNDCSLGASADYKLN